MKELIFRADDLAGASKRRAFVELVYQVSQRGGIIHMMCLYSMCMMYASPGLTQ